MAKKVTKPSSKTSARIKEPEVPPRVSFDSDHPVFSFELLDAEYCISSCERDEKAHLADTLRILGKQTWGEIRQSGRHQSGYEKIARGSIRGRIPREITEDVDHFIAFRFSGMKPMVGHKKDRVFYVIWLDRHFTLYPHD